MDEPLIRIDRSRCFSTVHGDRTPSDTHHDVASYQDGFPFDAAGALVPDDGRRQPWDEDVTLDNGTTVKRRHFPLWTDALARKLQIRIERIAQRQTENEDVSDVNLDAYLRGQIEYKPYQIFAAFKARHKKDCRRLPEVIDYLVYTARIVPEAEVAPGILAVLDQAA